MITEIITVIFYVLLFIMLFSAFKRLQHMKNYRHLYNYGSQHNRFDDECCEYEDNWYKCKEVHDSKYSKHVCNIYDDYQY